MMRERLRAMFSRLFGYPESTTPGPQPREVWERQKEIAARMEVLRTHAAVPSRERQESRE